MPKRRTGKSSARKVAAVRVEKLSVNSLAEPSFNNRTISDAALQGLSQSLADFGLVALPIVNVKDGKNEVLGGNQRIRLLRDAGIEDVMCVVVEMDDADARLANFTLNSPVIQGEFVPHLVKEVMERIRANAGDDHEKLFKRLRFDVLYRSTMRNLAASTQANGTEVLRGRVGDDDTPALGRTDTESKPGYYYALGDHVLYCGKIKEPGSLRNFGDVDQADMAFTRFVQEERFKDAYLDTYLMHTMQNTSGAVYIATTLDHLAHVQMRFTSLNGHWSTTLMAYEPKKRGRKSEQFRDVVVPVIYGWHESNSHFFYGGRDKSNLIELTSPAPKGDVPVELAVAAMQNSSRAGDVVLDAHVSQGATVIAAEKTGRRLIGYVRSARELDRVRHRWTRFVFGDKADWRTKTGEVG